MFFKISDQFVNGLLMDAVLNCARVPVGDRCPHSDYVRQKAPDSRMAPFQLSSQFCTGISEIDVLIVAVSYVTLFREAPYRIVNAGHLNAFRSCDVTYLGYSIFTDYIEYMFQIIFLLF